MGNTISSMRIDKFLKVSRLIKRRSIAKKACNDGQVFINGKEAKPGHNVSIGDAIDIHFGEDIVSVKVDDLQKHTKKSEADNLYHYC